MTCFSPLKGNRAPGGQVTFSSRGWSDRPIVVGCGQCIGCRGRRAADWTARIVHEAQLHGDRNSFVTLTYSDECMPPDGGLRYRDFQLFAKKLRKKTGPFRFFCAGEYGEENFRPHFHAVMFGQDFRADRVEWRKTELGDQVWRSPLLESTWSMGHCELGAVTRESAAYVAKYAQKKVSGDLAETRYARVDPDTGECWDVMPEFARMSLRPGLGALWFEKYLTDVYPSDEVILDGRRQLPPKYYDKLVESYPSVPGAGVPGPVLLEGLKSKRRRLADRHKEDLTPARMATRESVMRARLRAREL